MKKPWLASKNISLNFKYKKSRLAGLLKQFTRKKSQRKVAKASFKSLQKQGVKVMNFSLLPAFIDEISGEVILKDYSKWRNHLYEMTGIEFGTNRGDVTGRILYDSEGDGLKSRQDIKRYNNWELTKIKSINKSTGKSIIKLNIKGSPSKVFYRGRNLQNPTMGELQFVLEKLAKDIGIKLGNIKLKAPFEPSITIVNPQFSTNVIKDKLIVFQTKKPYQPYNKDGSNRFMGYKAENTHYYSKVYLPAVKFNLPKMNSLRIECHYRKLHNDVKKSLGIDTFEDFLNPEVQFRCGKAVWDIWDDTFIYDNSLCCSKDLKPYLNEIVEKGNDVKYWLDAFPKTATDKTLKARIKEYREYSCAKGDGLHGKIRISIENELAKFRNLT